MPAAAAAPNNKSARKENEGQVKSAAGKSASKSNKEREVERKSTSKQNEAAADKSKASKENEAEADTAHDKSAKKAAREDVFYQDEEEKEDLEAEEEETGLAPGTLSSAALPKERMQADDLQELSFEVGNAHLRVAKSRNARARALCGSEAGRAREQASVRATNTSFTVFKKKGHILTLRARARVPFFIPGKCHEHLHIQHASSMRVTVVVGVCGVHA